MKFQRWGGIFFPPTAILFPSLVEFSKDLSFQMGPEMNVGLFVLGKSLPQDFVRIYCPKT